MTTHSSILAWEIPWREEPGRLQVHAVAKSWTLLRDKHTQRWVAQRCYQGLILSFSPCLLQLHPEYHFHSWFQDYLTLVIRQVIILMFFFSQTIGVLEMFLKVWSINSFVFNWSIIDLGFLVAQMLKNLPAMQETLIWSMGWEDPLEKGMASHSSIPAWRIPWTQEPGRLPSMRSQRIRHDWVTNTHTHVVDLHYCVSFRSTAKCFRYIYIFSRLFSIISY